MVPDASDNLQSDLSPATSATLSSPPSSADLIGPSPPSNFQNAGFFSSSSKT